MSAGPPSASDAIGLSRANLVRAAAHAPVWSLSRKATGTIECIVDDREMRKMRADALVAGLKAHANWATLICDGCGKPMGRRFGDATIVDGKQVVFHWGCRPKNVADVTSEEDGL